MQQQEARLRRNDDPDLVIDFQPAATLEGLLIQKDLDMPAQLGLILRCQPMVIGDVPFQNLQPCPRKRTGTNFSAPLFSQSEQFYFSSLSVLFASLKRVRINGSIPREFK